MIKVTNRTLQIPSAEQNIGFVGDNAVETRQFEITDVSLFDLNFKLDIKSGGVVGIIDLVKTVEADRIILEWEVLKEHMPSSKILYAQLRAFADVEIWHSETGIFYVGESINATSYFPSPLPSEFEEIEQRVTATKNATLEAAEQVSEDKREVAEKLKIVLEKAGEASASAAAALLSEQHAKTSEDNTKEHEEEAERQAGIAANNILNGVSTHNSDELSHPHILGELTVIEAIARGKNSAKVFDTVEDMEEWLSVPENVETLNVGDNLYIVDVDVPDYWWDGEQPQVLEANSVNLSDYYTKTEVDARLPITIEQSDYDALVDAGQVIAGRIYYVVPDGTLEV